jgi:hypothetical protein
MNPVSRFRFPQILFAGLLLSLLAASVKLTLAPTMPWWVCTIPVLLPLVPVVSLTIAFALLVLMVAAFMLWSPLENHE